MDRSYRLRPRRIVLLYVVLAGFWIVASDWAATHFFPSASIHSYKGIAFVLATAALLYVVLARADASVRQFRASLTASREQFEQLVENAPEGIFIESGGRFRYLNPAALRMLGALDPGQLMDRIVLEAVAAEDQAAVGEMLRSVASGERAMPEAEVLLRRLDGTVAEAAMRAAQFEYNGERGAVVFIRDISARKRAERQEKHLEEQVRQAQKMESIGRLAGGVAHDFNNLLTVINGYAEMLLHDSGPDDLRRECLQEIRDAGSRAAALTRQLLAFSRKEQAQWASVDVNSVVRESEKMLGRLVGEHIRLRTELDPQGGTVLADPSWLDQVLMNLLVNARDAMPHGGEITIRTADVTVDEAFCRSESEAVPGRYVRLSVSDTGVGMPPEVQKRAFEPFYTTKPSGQGTGLGLSTVYGIVRQFQGWIAIDSQPGEGTSVTIWLPVRSSDAAAAPAAANGGALSGAETVLLVEDDASVRQAAVAMLRGYGYAVVAAEGPDEALRVAENFPGQIDLLLSDVMMPGMTGPALARLIREKLPHVKLMLMSGYREDTADSGKDLPFISKPFTAEGLARRVRAALDA